MHSLQNTISAKSGTTLKPKTLRLRERPLFFTSPSILIAVTVARYMLVIISINSADIMITATEVKQINHYTYPWCCHVFETLILYHWPCFRESKGYKSFDFFSWLSSWKVCTIIDLPVIWVAFAAIWDITVMFISNCRMWQVRPLDNDGYYKKLH